MKTELGLEPYVFTKVQRLALDIPLDELGLEPYVFTKVQRLIHPIIIAVIPALKPYTFTKMQR